MLDREKHPSKVPLVLVMVLGLSPLKACAVPCKHCFPLIILVWCYAVNHIYFSRENRGREERTGRKEKTWHFFLLSKSPKNNIEGLSVESFHLVFRTLLKKVGFCSVVLSLYPLILKGYMFELYAVGKPITCSQTGADPKRNVTMFILGLC